MNRFRTYALIATLLGGLSVVVGAFGAHGMQDPRGKSLLELGAHYQFMHAMASIASLTFWNWGATRARFAPPIFFAGTLLFCGSLYALALGAPRIVGAITPIGGTLFIVGWLILAWASPQAIARHDNDREKTP
jgi:uncharacterized membrane protein YgdD (TMEM256/DUF423 family)